MKHILFPDFIYLAKLFWAAASKAMTIHEQFIVLADTFILLSKSPICIRRADTDL